MHTTLTKPRPELHSSATHSAVTRPRRAISTPAAHELQRHQGHGRRLLTAFETLETFPALSESRDRLLSVLSKDHVATADVVAAIESDVALMIALLRLANDTQGAGKTVDTAVSAVAQLTPDAVQAVV